LRRGRGKRSCRLPNSVHVMTWTERVQIKIQDDQ
jgi:hypothetical protein